MNIHVLQHVPFEDIGSMSDCFRKMGASVHYTRFFEGQRLPALRTCDCIVAMGGPMSVNDENVFPWLRTEKEFLRDAIESRIPVLGICLGAQLIANALDARVYPNTQKEIGWFPVEKHDDAGESLPFPERCQVFHWHGETFDLPQNAVVFAQSDACRNQAFYIGDSVIGLQFHLEMTPADVDAIIQNCKNELIPGGPFIQTESEIRAVPVSVYTTAQMSMNGIVAYLLNTRGDLRK